MPKIHNGNVDIKINIHRLFVNLFFGSFHHKFTEHADIAAHADIEKNVAVETPSNDGTGDSIKISLGTAKQEPLPKQCQRACSPECLFCGNFVIGMLCCSVFFAIITLLATPVLMVILGAVYANSCPSCQMIPVFNIVCGLIIMFRYFIIMLIIVRIQEIRKVDNICLLLMVTRFLVTLFFIGWTVAGSVWVFEDYPKQCNEVIYKFSIFSLVWCYFCILDIFISACKNIVLSGTNLEIIK